MLQAGGPAGHHQGGLSPLCPGVREHSFADLSAQGWRIRECRSWIILHFPSTKVEEDSGDFPAVAETVDEKVDAAVNGEEEVADQEQLSTLELAMGVQ